MPEADLARRTRSFVDSTLRANRWRDRLLTSGEPASF